MSNDVIVQLENKFYISANSSYADNRIKVLNHTDTFAIFDRYGDIKQVGDGIQGIYHEGTRFISESEFQVNGARPLLLSSSVKEENEILSVDLTNPVIPESENRIGIPKSSVHIRRSKFIRNGACYEKIEFINYGPDPYEFTCSLSFNADFHDIFEVRGMSREKRGEIFEIKHLHTDLIVIRYIGLDNIERTTYIKLYLVPDHWQTQEKAIYKISLGHHESFLIGYSMNFETKSSLSPRTMDYSEAEKMMREDLIRSQKGFADIFTSNEQLNHWINRSKTDLISLLAQAGEGKYPYAGVPWYNTPFGRDGIITAFQALWIAPDIARDVLLFLARYQATDLNSFQDAEPGKIFHEMRGGEMVETGEIPFKKYYGSVDATPLFIGLAGAYFQRTADLQTIQNIWPNIEAALQWIEKYGDIDGDGFVEYHHKSANGLINQGWKDSLDSISDEWGNLAEPPVALCEVQAYVYDAKLKASYLASVLNKNEFAEKLRNEALLLKEKFHKSFWDEKLGTYVLALDGNKKPCRVLSSNAGHCLFSGIADRSVASQQVKTLMGEEMFSGWGIRTLGKNELRYNPMSYHNGSVWPHDVAMIAYGFSRYGFHNETIRLTGGLFDVSLFLELQRLPELFCGFHRRNGEGPTAYPVACSPQAWSVGAVFLLIESCLRMEINAPEHKLHFRKPVLPEFIDNILITRLQLGNEYASVELHRYKDDTGLVIKNLPASWEVLLIK